MEKTNKKLFWIIGIIAVLVILGGVLYNNFSKSKETIKIGYLGPLTGDVAAIGQGQQKAIMLAVEEINSAGGINGRQIEMIYEDGKCNGADAATATNKLVNVDGVKYIVGGQCSSETLAAAPIAESSKVVLISPLSSNPAITNSGDFIFRVYPSDSFQGKVAAEYAYNNLKARNVAVLSCLDDWCKGLSTVFKNEFVSLGGKIVESQEFEKTSNDLKTQLTKIKTSNPDLIYMPSYTEATVVGLKQAKELGIDTKFLGGDAWDDKTIWDNTKGLAEGDMYLVPKSPINADFDNRFHKEFGENQSIVLAALNNYDAVYIFKQVISQVGDDSIKVKNALYNLKYSGLSGDIAFDSNGDLKSANYDVKIIRNSIAQIASN
jgi:branched-chain amino acid transport system substrate-binding protein